MLANASRSLPCFPGAALAEFHGASLRLARRLRREVQCPPVPHAPHRPPRPPRPVARRRRHGQEAGCHQGAQAEAPGGAWPGGEGGGDECGPPAWARAPIDRPPAAAAHATPPRRLAPHHRAGVVQGPASLGMGQADEPGSRAARHSDGWRCAAPVAACSRRRSSGHTHRAGPPTFCPPSQVKDPLAALPAFRVYARRGVELDLVPYWAADVDKSLGDALFELCKAWGG